MKLALPWVWLHHILSRRFELYRLEKAARTHESPELPILEWITHNKAVWRLSVPGQKSCFMSVSSGAINQDCFVVYLDAERFYHAWLKASPTMQLPRSWDCIWGRLRKRKIKHAKPLAAVAAA